MTPGICGNMPHGGPPGLAPPADPSGMARAMADRALLWEPGAEVLVRFLDGADAWGQAIRRAVQERAPVWSQYANLRFRFVASGQADVLARVTPAPGASYGMYSCYLGTDCRQVSGSGQAALNLVFHPSLASNPDFMRKEFDRVILHELGHCGGLIHEHMRPDRPIRWDLGALYRYCADSFGWGQATVDQQIVAEYQPRKPGSMAGGAFDPRSIMMYAYPPGIATYADGSPFEAPNNAALTPGDKVLAAMLYPTAVASPDEAALAPGVATSGRIAAAGQVGRYRFTPGGPGDYAIEATADAPVLLSLLSSRGDPAGRMLAAEGTTPRIAFHPLQPGKEYYVEVRAARPTSGTGSFAVAVHPPGGTVVPAKPIPRRSTWEDAFT